MLAKVPAEWLGAISSIFIAIFSLTLWLATDRLWRISLIHANHMERSVKAAQDSSKAAVATAKTAERALAELERAYIFPSITDVHGPDLGFRIRLRSLGRIPAIIKEVAIKFNGNIPLSGKPDMSGPIVVQDFDWAINDMEWTDLFNSPCAGEQHFFGFVRYLDIFNKEHRSWFGIYIDATGRPFRAGGDEYNS